MLNKKIAIITLAAVISNFSFATTNVLADEITKNVKIVAQTKNNQNLKTKKSNKSKNESKLSESKSNESNSERTFTLAQNGNISWKARNDLRMTYFGTDYQSTGIVARPGETFTVYVEADEGAPMPKIAFSQHEALYSNWVRWYDLKPGKNVITVPEIYDNSWSNKTVKGGAVYLLNRYTAKEQGKAPVVTIEGGETFPIYNEGDDKAAFIEKLKAYKQKLDQDPENTVDLFEFNTERLLYTGTASAAYKVYVEEGVDVGESAANLNSQVQEMFDFSGLKNDPTDPNNDSTNVKTTIRLMQPYGLAYAYGDHVGIQRDYEQSMLRTDLSSLGSVIWTTVHEAGHQMDISAREWPEVTNNMWANNAHIKNGFQDRVNYTYLYKYLAPEKSLRGFDTFDYFQQLGMFWQLQLKKDTYWAELETLYRERKPSPRDYQHKKDILATYSSEVLGINLTYYFEKYGFTLSDECKQNLKKYPDSNEKLWYLNSTVIGYTGSGYTNTDTGLQLSISKVKSGVKLSMAINNSKKDDLLGYEILKDGKVIGFTSSNTYIDENATDDNAQYAVIPYAKDLTSANKVEINSKMPSISIQQEKITLKVGEKFDAKAYVKGLTYTGEDITSNIKIENNVNPNKKGNYTVNYELTNEGQTTIRNIEVEVVSDYDYLSDLSWETIKTAWGIPRTNTNIQGMVHEQVTKLKKGIGIHANGKITYDLSDKDYQNFEALIGVDTAVGQNDYSSVTFKISADGKTLATTNVMHYGDNLAYINVPVAGVKELVIEVYDGGNGNTCDHCIITNPKLTKNNGTPKFTGEDKIAFNINEDIDILKGIKATDAEDGDLTENIQVETDYIEGNTGIFNVNCFVTDNDGNKTTFKRTVVVSEKETYLSDLNYEYGTIGSGYIGKDKSVREETIQLLNEDGTYQEFKKGIGTHSYSEIVYDSTGYDIFDTWVGLDKFVSNQEASSVIFKVYVDNELKAQTGLMKSDSPKQRLIVDIRNSKKIKLVVEEADNGDTWDHADWADAKFRNLSKFDLTELEKILEQAKSLDLRNYTDESAQMITKAIQNGEKALKSTNQEIINKAVENLQNAVNNAVEIDLNKIIEIKDKNLKLSIQQELGLPGEIRLGDIRELTSLTVKNKEIKSLEGLQYAVNLESLNIQNNEIKDLSPLKNLKKLNNLQADPQTINEDWFWAKGQGVEVDFNITNRKGQKLNPTSIVIKDNRTWKTTTLNIEECTNNNGKISFSTQNFYKGIHTLYLTYQDKDDNYKTEITFLIDNREK